MKSSIYTEERRKEILSLLQRQKRVSVNELNKLYQVSGTTIRLDLAALEKKGLLVRTHGGAVLPESSDLFVEPVISERHHEDEKSRIAKAALNFLVPDETISFVDGHMGPYAENLAQDCGDFYLRRADGVFAYQLAVVVDDALMGVTQVVRGADLLSSTPRQLWLYRELGLTPPTFYHLPLLLASDGRRLSKRDGDQSLENLRARYSAEEIIGKLAFACGLQATPRPVTPQELAADFDWAKVPKNDIVLPESMF